LAKRYTQILKKLPEIKCPTTEPRTISAQHNYVIQCKNRDKLHLFLRERNISSGVHYMPLHLQPYYKKLFPKVRLPIVEAVWKSLLTLPLYPDLTIKEQDYIIHCIKAFYEEK
jgi:dTDP-4-amino-4,6-dideoxygalactose transaminase